MNGKQNAGVVRQRAVERLLQGEGLVDSVTPVTGQEGPRSPEELAAYRHAQAVWEALPGLKTDPGYAALLGRPTWRERLAGWRSSLPEVRRERRSFWAVGGAALAAGLIALAWLGMQPSGAVYNTNIAEIRELALEDGSTIALGAKSRLTVTFSEDQRVVDMEPGEAFFSVTPDPERPFIILAGDTHISVVGTKFNVKYDGENVRVSVTEGMVKVAPPRLPPSFRDEPQIPVVAGTEVLIAADAEEPDVRPLASLPAETWLSGRLAYEDASLKEIIADVNRYLPGKVVISSERLAQERLTASFRADQAAAFLQSLPQVIPVRLEGRIGQTVVLTEASSG